MENISLPLRYTYTNTDSQKIFSNTQRLDALDLEMDTNIDISTLYKKSMRDAHKHELSNEGALKVPRFAGYKDIL